VPVQDSITQAVNGSEMIVPDETGWRVGGEGAWLWVASCRRATAYWVADGRGFEEACEVISPEFSGVMVRDGWVVYRRFEKATHQSCLAHLTRRCDELIMDLPAVERRTPRKVRDILTEALDARDLDDDDRAAVVADLAERVEMLADDAHPHNENRKLVAHLYNERAALFSFLTHPGVDATNWRAEYLRPTKLHRKISGCFRSQVGAERFAHLRSYLSTTRKNGVLAHRRTDPSVRRQPVDAAAAGLNTYPSSTSLPRTELRASGCPSRACCAESVCPVSDDLWGRRCVGRGNQVTSYFNIGIQPTGAHVDLISARDDVAGSQGNGYVAWVAVGWICTCNLVGVTVKARWICIQFDSGIRYIDAGSERCCIRLEDVERNLLHNERLARWDRRPNGVAAEGGVS
jgi:hypothetical protein